MLDTIIENFIGTRIPVRRVGPTRGTARRPRSKNPSPPPPNKNQPKPKPKPKSKPDADDAPNQPKGPNNVPDSGGGGGFGGMNLSDMLSLAGVGLMAYSIFGMGSSEEPPLTDENAPANEEYPTSGDPNASAEYADLPENEAYLKSLRPGSTSTGKTDYSAYFKLFLLIAFILIIAVLIYKYTNRNTEEEQNS